MKNGGGIGTLQERSLHAALKELYDGPNTQSEVEVDGYVIDVVQNDLLIEIQTRNFSAIKNKLAKLMKKHRVRLVHPIAKEKIIIQQDTKGNILGKRRSPKKGTIANIFEELVRIPTFLISDNFELEVILTREEEIRIKDGTGSWRRRGWSICDHNLVEVIDRRLFQKPGDMLSLIPETIIEPFTTRSLSERIAISQPLAQKMTYCMRKMEIVKRVGKEGNAYLYETIK